MLLIFRTVIGDGMTTIAAENVKPLRRSMDVFCGLSARTNVDLTFSISGQVSAQDSNVSVALDSETWDMRRLTDLAGGGFPVDGSVKLHDTSLAGSLANGKVGLRSARGGTFAVNVSCSSNIAAVTIATRNGSEGTGTVSCAGRTYDVRRITVIPVNAKTATLVFTATDPDRRLEIASITPGISLTFDNSSLVSVVAALRSDLSMDNPSWAESEIEIKAYYPDDISEAISNINDDVPIWYYAGYEGDYSQTRNFYLSEPAKMEGSLITLKGVDASRKLDKKTNIAQVLNTTQKNGKQALYNRFVNFITDSGIKLVSTQAAPAQQSGTTAYSYVWKEATSRDIVADMMNLSHYADFWPTFVDAGIPKATWSKPTKKWDIYEDMCGEVVRTVERNIAKITTTDEYGLHSTAKRNTAVQNLQTRDVVADKGYYLEPEGFWWYLSVTNAKSQLATASKIVWTANKTTTRKKVKVKTNKKYTSGKNKGKWIYKEETKVYDQAKVTGKSITVENTGVKSIIETDKRPGTEIQVTPVGVGRAYGGTTLLYPYYGYLFLRSNITGSFLFRGNPHMQPRDVFDFHRVDGSVETCTIESITITHEEGGTKAELTYRKGIC